MQWHLFSSDTVVLVITAVGMVPVVAAKGVAVVVVVALVVVVPAVVCNCCTCHHFRCVEEKIWLTLRNVVIAGDFNADFLSYDRNGSKLKLLSMLLLEKRLIPVPSFLI